MWRVALSVPAAVALLVALALSAWARTDRVTRGKGCVVTVAPSRDTVRVVVMWTPDGVVCKVQEVP